MAVLAGGGYWRGAGAGTSPSEDGRIRAPCMIRVLRTAKTPLGGKMFARCIPQRRFAGLSGYIARISCQNKLNPNTWRRYIATNRCFSCPMPLRERIGAISCHGRQLENASGRYLAMARRRMIATEVHRRPISDCNGLLGIALRRVSDTESRDSKRLSFVQLERSETSCKSFGFQHLRVYQVTKRSLAHFCHFFVAHVSIMN